MDFLIKVHHAEDTTTSDNMLDFWKKHSNKSLPKVCPCCKEPLLDPVGAHVIDRAGIMYITPKRRECNSAHKPEEFSVTKEDLVSLQLHS